MKKSTSTRSATILLGLLSLSLLLPGCWNSEEEETVTTYDGPIDGWEDVAIPEGSTLSQPSSVAGVENHFFEIPDYTEAEFFAFVETTMPTQDWLPNASSDEVRQFIKNGDLVSYNSDGVIEGKFHFVVIIEPEGVYGDSEEEEESI